MKVCPKAEGILGGREAEGFCPGDIITAPEALVEVEGDLDKCRVENSEASNLQHRVDYRMQERIAPGLEGFKRVGVERGAACLPMENWLDAKVDVEEVTHLFRRSWIERLIEDIREKVLAV